ncbi:MAG: sigma-70 family RNA polymerase sigma factor [Planctomycetes bacterium]|nr:sigma-70 family RNA polymerase sigma factor [Planctomycetota bacterium]
MVGAGTDGGFDISRAEELGRRGFALALQLVRNREDAADVVQDALHAAIRKRHLYDPGRGDQRAWFLKIVRNRCLDLIRKHRRRNEESSELLDTAASRERNPGEEAEARDDVRQLKEVLMAMPDEQREVILLRDYHDLSYAEMATVLGIRAGTVMSRLHRARTELRRRVGRTSG